MRYLLIGLFLLVDLNSIAQTYHQRVYRDSDFANYSIDVNQIDSSFILNSIGINVYDFNRFSELYFVENNGNLNSKKPIIIDSQTNVNLIRFSYLNNKIKVFGSFFDIKNNNKEKLFFQYYQNDSVLGSKIFNLLDTTYGVLLRNKFKNSSNIEYVISQRYKRVNNRLIADANLLKIKNDSIIVFERNYRLKDKGNVAFPSDLIFESDEKIFLVGGIQYPSLQNDIYIVKLDTNGTKIFEKTLNYTVDVQATKILEGVSNLYLLSGYIRTKFPSDFNPHGILICIDKDGKKKWEKIYSGSEYSGFYSAEKLNDSVIIAVGVESVKYPGSSFPLRAEGCVYALNAKNGDSLWSYRIALTDSSEITEFFNIQKLNDGGFGITGYATNHNQENGTQDPIFIKIDSNGCPVANCDLKIRIYETPVSNSQLVLHPCYPNPFQTSTTIKVDIPNDKLKDNNELIIMNSLGQLVHQEKLYNNENIISISLSNFPTGLYFYSLVSNGSIIQTKKMEVIR